MNITPKEVIKLLDLTWLPNDRNTISNKECEHFWTLAEQYKPYGVCLYGPHNVSDLKQIQVINFPYGNDPIYKIFNDIKEAVVQGVYELDIVWPEINFQPNDYAYFFSRCRDLAEDKSIKWIINTDMILDRYIWPEKVIYERVEAVVTHCGYTDMFIKTCTGKLNLEGVNEKQISILLNAINYANDELCIGRIGLKLSGGIKTYEQALGFITQVADVMGEDYIKPSTFRIGASIGLLEDLINKSK